MGAIEEGVPLEFWHLGVVNWIQEWRAVVRFEIALQLLRGGDRWHVGEGVLERIERGTLTVMTEELPGFGFLFGLPLGLFFGCELFG